MSPVTRILAPAKLNLFLHITGKRPDGYHLLDSLAVFTSFGDILELSASDTLSLTLTGPFAAALESGTDNNLVLRAARALQQRTSCSKGAHIALHKHIPVGAGLGGGSSDAAAIITGLEQLWGLSLAAAARNAMALALGSDVPACLSRQPVRIRGIGEQLQPVAIPQSIRENTWCLLVNPNTPLLTADIYRRFTGPFSPPADAPQPGTSFASLVHYLQSRHNALEPAALTVLPVIGDILSALGATSGCALARMSGSGATCFGLYGSEAQALGAQEQFQSQHPGWWMQATPFIQE